MSLLGKRPRRASATFSSKRHKSRGSKNERNEKGKPKKAGGWKNNKKKNKNRKKGAKPIN